MTTPYEFLSSTWAQALGWTLIHSIWQSLLIFLTVFCFRRFTSIKLANLRYVFSLGGLAAILVSSLTTFLYILSQLDSQPIANTGAVYVGQLILNASGSVADT